MKRFIVSAVSTLILLNSTGIAAATTVPSATQAPADPASNTNTSAPTTTPSTTTPPSDPAANPATPEDPPQTAIGLAEDRAMGLVGEIKETLSKIPGAITSTAGAATGGGLTFSDTATKTDNTENFRQLVSTQLKLYELLYRTGIESELTAPIKETSLPADAPIGTLKEYLTALNAINKFIDTQLAQLDNTKPLYAALSAAKVDLSAVQATTISATKPLKTAEDATSVRTIIQTSLSASTPIALDKFMVYLNDGNDSTKPDALKANTVVEDTKKILTLINDWAEVLPDVNQSTSAIGIPQIGSVNAPWIVALGDLVKVVDTGGDTNPTGEINTDPTLATSAIGRLGSSLFSVARAKNADLNPEKPATGTLSWTVDDSLRHLPKYKDTDPGPAAKDTYLAMFAATAVYTPFVSKVGDKDYLEAYKALFGTGVKTLKDDNEAVTYPGSNTGPLDILSTVQNLKKPLYYFADTDSLGPSTLYGHSTLDVQGNTQILTVGALLTSVKDKKDLAAVTRNGVAQRDGDAWSFYNYSVNSSGEVETTADDAQTKAANAAQEVSTEPILNKVSADSDTNAGNTTTRVLFEMTFNDKKPGAALITGMLMHNTYQDTMLKGKLEARSGEVVYIDAIGNIVLNDGTVVLPAAANPIYWAQPAVLDASSSFGGVVGQALIPGQIELWYYNPFTVAMMDTYPIIFQAGSAPSTVNGKKDKDKFLFSAKTTSDTTYDVNILPIKGSFGISNFSRASSVLLFDQFKMDGIAGSKSDVLKRLTESVTTEDKKDATTAGMFQSKFGNSPVQMGNLLTSNGDSIFPYLPQNNTDAALAQSFTAGEENYTSAIYVAKNMYAYIIGEMDKSNADVSPADGKSLGGSNTSSLREGFLFNNVTMPNLTGIVSGVEFDKSLQKTNLLAAGGNTDFFPRWTLAFASWIMKTADSTKNVLSISNSDEVSAYRLLYTAFTNYGFYFLFIFLVLLLFIYLKDNSLTSTLLKGGTIAGAIFVTLFLLPVVIPKITGYLTEPLTRSLSSKAIVQQLEQVSKVNTVQSAGDSNLSVKLYNLSVPQAKKMSEENRNTVSDFLMAKYPVNNSVGMFVNGTDLRLDISAFWRSDPLVIGSKNSVNDPNDTTFDVTQIYHSNHSKSDYVLNNDSVKSEFVYNRELIDYYMPFNMLEDGLINTLNRYLVYYKPMQSVVKYPDGLVRTSYIVNTYTRSLAFLSADPNINKLIAESTDPDSIANLGLDKLEADLVNEKFFPYGDIMNLQPFVESELEDLTPTQANSIWAQTMRSSGYYDPVNGYEKRLKLANKVNREVYDMFIRLKDLNGQVSDETLIKLISMYATFVWNDEISFIGHNAYPQTVSLNELSVENLLSATVLMDSTRYLYYDVDLVSNVNADHGLLGAIVLTVAALGLMLYSMLVSWVLPVLIFVLIVFIILKVLRGEGITQPVLLSLKLVGLLVAMNALLVLLLISYDKFSVTIGVYLLTLMVVVIDVLFIYLFKRILFHKKKDYESSWQSKQLKSMGLSGYPYSHNEQMNYYQQNNNSYYSNRYENNYEYGYEEETSRGYERQYGIEESSGAATRSSRSGRRSNYN